MYVDSRVMKHHKAILSIAKSIREHSNNEIQTSIRTGKHDFLIRTRPRGSDTPWSEIAPIQIVQKIPEFEIGTYQDMINPQNNRQGEEDEPEYMVEEYVEEVEDIEEIIQDISRQNSDEQDNKRDRTADSTASGKKKQLKRSNNSTIPNSSPEASGDETDDEQHQKKILNSTPNTIYPLQRYSRTLSAGRVEGQNREIEHFFSVPETPQWRLQSGRVRKQPSIPETPEPADEKSSPALPAARKKTHNDQFNDDEIIQEMSQSTTTHHG